MHRMKLALHREHIPALALRLGLAFVLAYAAISAFRTPAAWLSFVPHLVTRFISADLFLKLFSVFQLAMAAALILGKYVRYTAALAGMSIAGLVAFNMNTFLITFRDVGLVFMAVALFFMDSPAPKKKTRK